MRRAPPYKVLVVDDSALIRKLLSDILNSSRNLRVVGVAKDPFDAREKIKSLNPDVMTLDIEMPRMDGLTFLQKVMSLRPMPVVMISTLTAKGANATMKALSMGAIDFVEKPKIDISHSLRQYAEELVAKVEHAAGVEVRQRPALSAPIKRNFSSAGIKQQAELVAIGASTGGTIALEAVITSLPAETPPIVIAQHIPPVFSAAFAERINKCADVEVREARDGDKLVRGQVLVAPGGIHMEVGNRADNLVVSLHDKAKVSGHRPSVDVLFESILNTDVKSCLAILLTGMGSDGARGLKKLYGKGAWTVAQDEQSSLIWGMPRKAIELGAAREILALDDIPGKICSPISGFKKVMRDSSPVLH